MIQTTPDSLMYFRIKNRPYYTDPKIPMPKQRDTSTESQLIAQRRAKLDLLHEAGQAYPNDFRRDSLAGELHERFTDATAEELVEQNVSVLVAGRMMTQRVQGKTSFANIKDMSGQIQLFIRHDALPEGVYLEFKKWDLGDIVGAGGSVYRTSSGELSV